MANFNFLDKQKTDAGAGMSSARSSLGGAANTSLHARKTRKMLILAIGAALVAFSVVVIVGLFLQERRAARAGLENPAPGIDQRQFEAR